jgi:hypothetical protein
MYSVIVAVFVALSVDAVAQNTRTYCGVRSGTAGNAYLDARNSKDSLTLAEQGGPQQLLEQIDILVGPYRHETGTQNGQRYCTVALLNSHGEPVKIVKAWRQK